MSPARPNGRRRTALRHVLEARTDAAEVEPSSILHREFWRAPTPSPLRLVFSSSER